MPTQARHHYSIYHPPAGLSRTCLTAVLNDRIAQKKTPLAMPERNSSGNYLTAYTINPSTTATSVVAISVGEL